MFGYIALLGGAQLTVAVYGNTVILPVDKSSIEDGVWTLYSVLAPTEAIGTFEIVGGKAREAVLKDDCLEITLDREMRDELVIALNPEAIKEWLAAL